MGHYPQVVYCGQEYARPVLQSTDFSDKIEAGRGSVNQRVSSGFWYVYTGAMKMRSTLLFETTRITLPYVLFSANAVQWKPDENLLHFDAWTVKLSPLLANRVPDSLKTRQKLVTQASLACSEKKITRFSPEFRQEIVTALKPDDWTEADVYPSEDPLSVENPEYARCRVNARKRGGSLLGGYGGNPRGYGRGGGHSGQNQRRGYNNNINRRGRGGNYGGQGGGGNYGRGRDGFRGGRNHGGNSNARQWRNP